MRVRQGGQSGARARWFDLSNRAADAVQSLLQKVLGVERSVTRQKFIEEYAQAVDVAARVDIQPAHLRLFRAHVSGRADELVQFRIDSAVGQAALRGFGDAEVNDLRNRHAVVQGDQNVRRLQVAVDDSLLMCMLYGVADLDEQLQSLVGVEVILVAIIRDANAANQFHHEVRTAVLGGAGVEHFGDVWMVHDRQRLALRLEASDNLPGVHPQLDDLQGDSPADRLFLLGHIDNATPTFTKLLAQFVMTDARARLFFGW